MVELIIVSIFALIVIGYQGWLIKKMTEQFDKERKDLLNRIMCRDFAQFVQGAIAHKQVDRALTAEEIAEMQAERGIPV